MTANLQNLPTEIKLRILSHLTLSERACAALICVDWFEAVLGSYKSFSTIELLEHFEKIARLYNSECGTRLRWFDLFAYTSHLKDVSIYADCDEMLLEFGKHGANLSKLHICELHLSKSFIDVNPTTKQYFKTSSLTCGTPLALANASCLKELVVEYPVIGAQWKKSIPPTVTILRINFPNFKDSTEDFFCLDYICQNPSNIEEFSFLSNFHVKGFLREKYGALHNLRKINIAAAIPSATVQPWFREVASQVPLLFLLNCPRLCEFNYGFPCITKSWYRAVPGNISSLYLRNIVYVDNIHEEFVPAFFLQEPSSLKTLKMTEFVESAVARWSKGSFALLTQLKCLQLTTDRIPDSCVKDVTSNNALEVLNLNNVNLTAFSDLSTPCRATHLELSTHTNYYKLEFLKTILREFPRLQLLAINTRLSHHTTLQELFLLLGHLNCVHLRAELDIRAVDPELNDSMFESVMIRVKKPYTHQTCCLELLLEKNVNSFNVPFACIDEEDIVYVKGRFAESVSQKPQICTTFPRFLMLTSCGTGLAHRRLGW